jgi:hypothetical protein
MQALASNSRGGTFSSSVTVFPVRSGVRAPRPSRLSAKGPAFRYRGGVLPVMQLNVFGIGSTGLEGLWDVYLHELIIRETHLVEALTLSYNGLVYFFQNLLLQLR